MTNVQAEMTRSSEERLLDGFAAAVAEKGYAKTTIHDIVRHARMSKRTFYERFPDKEGCFLAAYQVASERILQTIAAAVDPGLAVEEQIRAAIRAYVGVLEENVAVTRTFFLEIHAGGQPALELRREVHRRFAELLRALVASGRAEHPEVPKLTRAMSVALVGGINELVLAGLERDVSFRTVEKTATELVEAVLTGAR